MRCLWDKVSLDTLLSSCLWNGTMRLGVFSHPQVQGSSCMSVPCSRERVAPTACALTPKDM